MFLWLYKLMKSIKNSNCKGIHASSSKAILSTSLDNYISYIESALHDSTDLVIRRFQSQSRDLVLLYIDGLVDIRIINDHIIHPLMQVLQDSTTESDFLFIAQNHLVTASNVSQINKIDEILAAILSGDSVLLVDKGDGALRVSSKGWEKRSIEEPDTEVIIKGPREGFIETLRTNTALLRRRIGDPDLVIESMQLGKRTKTDICIIYINGIAKDSLVDEVKARLNRIDTDAIMAAGYIEQFIEDAPLSLFATVSYTERPDVTAAKLLEGRVAIFVDGTPTVSIVPMLFVENFQSFDDFNFRPFYSTIIRLIRFMSFLISIALPASFVALSSFHQELLSTPLLVSIAAAQEGTPFPIAFEVISLGVAFELLREAGIRLPRPIGQAVSIVGALVLGQAAVQAGIVGAPTVIITAVTAISSFLVPAQVEVAAVLRFGFLVLAGICGAFGLYMGVMFVMVYLASLRSFGIPYLSPLAPLVLSDLKDVFVRFPHWAMITRPESLEPSDIQRSDNNLRPSPLKGD